MKQAETIYFFEFTSVTIGYGVLNEILAIEHVDVIEASPHAKNCFFILLKASFTEAEIITRTIDKACSPEHISHRGLITNPHPALLPALYNLSQPQVKGAIAIVSTEALSKSLLLANTWLSQYQIELVELKTGRGFDGRSYFIISSDAKTLKEIETEYTKCSARGVESFQLIINPNPRFLSYFNLK